MALLGEVRLVAGAYDGLMDGNFAVGGETAAAGKEETRDEEIGVAKGKRIRVAGGKYWDVILHVLPKGA